MDSDKLRERCDRFRVLVIGRANAGKTTILQKMCGTTENPVIRTWGGHGYEDKKTITTLDVTAGRGIHSIEDELTFPNNPGFIFHDSCGFEAGSTEEVENVHAFIAARAASGDLAKQVHVVWICLPTDTSRPLQRTEMAFFEHGTGNVPAIAVFTKFDGLDLVHFAELRDQGKSRSEARQEAPKLADTYFEEHHLKRIKSTMYPPAGYVCLRNMHKPDTECGELTQKTIDALDNDVLRRLFASVQNTNIQVCIENAIDDAIDECWGIISSRQVVTNEMMKKIGLRILTWFPHLMRFEEDLEHLQLRYTDTNADINNNYATEIDVFDFGADVGRDAVKSRWKAALDPVIDSLVGPSPIEQQALRLIASIAIIGEHSFQLLKHSKSSDAVQGLESYLKSPQAKVVSQAVDDTFPTSPWVREGGPGDETARAGKEIKQRLVEVVLANLIPKDYYTSQKSGE